MILNSPVKQIDHVLSILREHSSFLNAEELIEIVGKSSIVVEPSVLARIIEKLERDKYIYITKHHDVDYYSISFEGDLFIGYEKQEILDNETIEALSIAKQEAKDYSTRLLWATWCAGIAAVLLLLWQIFVWLHPLYSHYPYILFGVKP